MVRRLIEIFDEKQKHTLNYPERFGNKLAGGGGGGGGGGGLIEKKKLSSYGRSYHDFAGKICL